MAATVCDPFDEPMNNPREVLSFLRAGDSLVVDSSRRWMLLRAEVEVTATAADTLRVGGPLLEKFGGRLVPGCDCLPGIHPHLSQTWEWHDAASERVS